LQLSASLGGEENKAEGRMMKAERFLIPSAFICVYLRLNLDLVSVGVHRRLSAANLA